MRRTLRGLAVVAAGMLLTAGCAGSGASPAGPAPLTDGIGPITFAIGKDNPGWLQEVITGWNSRYPGQKVTLLLLPQASNDQLAQLVANLQAKSDEYDVIDMDVIWTAEFASNGWIIPLPENQFPLGEFLKPAVASAMYQGRLYAVPDYSNADLLYYRKDILAKAGQPAPRTWAQLQRLAETVAPRYGLYGYAGTFAPYEGLTVNFAAAVQSAGGSILSPEGTRVTVNSAQALQGLDFLVNGFRQGWIPKVTLTYEEVSSQNAFEAGKFLFLDNWPDVYAALSVPGPQNKVYGKAGIAALPGPDGTGSSSLGGANLAISAYSRHQRTALNFIKYMTDLANERQMLEQGSFPPVWTRLYTEPSLVRSHPYLPVLEQAIDSAQPRPAITNYDQASLAISSAVYEALTRQKQPQQALADMAGQLTQIIRDG
ncbi:MAG: ABC transporter substrate-binding protein [Actinobacteria bacterium]|nr:ABC transporter substrate-binding protein [Actinomycetota bacterium]